MRVYIAGKITGLPEEEYKANFQRVEDYLHSLDMQVVNPVKLIEAIQSVLPWEMDYEEIMEYCFDALDECDLVYFQRNWVESIGAGREMERARDKKIVVVLDTGGAL